MTESAEVEKSVLIHRRGFEHREIDVDEAAIVIGRLAEVHRNVAAEPAIVHLAFEAGKVPRDDT